MKIVTVLFAFAASVAFAAPVPATTIIEPTDHTLTARGFNPFNLRRPQIDNTHAQASNTLMETKLAAASHQQTVAQDRIALSQGVASSEQMQALNKLNKASQANQRAMQKAFTASTKAKDSTAAAHDAHLNAAFARANAAAAFKRPTGIVDMAKKTGAVITTGTKSLISNIKANFANARAESAMKKAAASQQKFDATHNIAKGAFKPQQSVASSFAASAAQIPDTAAGATA